MKIRYRSTITNLPQKETKTKISPKRTLGVDSDEESDPTLMLPVYF